MVKRYHHREHVSVNQQIFSENIYRCFVQLVIYVLLECGILMENRLSNEMSWMELPQLAVTIAIKYTFLLKQLKVFNLREVQIFHVSEVLDLLCHLNPRKPLLHLNNHPFHLKYLIDRWLYYHPKLAKYILQISRNQKFHVNNK